MLIEHGADADIRDGKGRSLLHASPRYRTFWWKHGSEQNELLKYLVKVSAPDAALERCHIEWASSEEWSEESYLPFEMALLSHNKEVAYELFKPARDLDRFVVDARLQDYTLPTSMKWKAELHDNDGDLMHPHTESAAH